MEKYTTNLYRRVFTRSAKKTPEWIVPLMESVFLLSRKISDKSKITFVRYTFLFVKSWIWKKILILQNGLFWEMSVLIFRNKIKFNYIKECLYKKEGSMGSCLWKIHLEVGKCGSLEMKTNADYYFFSRILNRKKNQNIDLSLQIVTYHISASACLYERPVLLSCSPSFLMFS